MLKNKLNTSLNLYKKMYLIRRCEEKIVEHYDSNEMKTPMHMSMGEEAAVVGVASTLKKTDFAFGTYRSHALYLALTNEVKTFFAEMFGRANGAIEGKGGSMHLSNPEKGLLATSAVVATTIPLAVGTSFSIKLKKANNISVVFFGDGAIDEGTFWESLNMACLFKTPVVFVCEDNGFAVHTPPSERHGYNSIVEIVSKFNCKVFDSDSTDVEEINKIAQNAVDFTRKSQIPSFLYLKYYRYLEHVGTHEDFQAGYREKKEFSKWVKKDPIKVQRNKLLNQGIDEAKLKKAEDKILKIVNDSFEEAAKSPFPKKENLLKGVYYEG